MLAFSIPFLAAESLCQVINATLIPFITYLGYDILCQILCPIPLILLRLWCPITGRSPHAWMYSWLYSVSVSIWWVYPHPHHPTASTTWIFFSFYFNQSSNTLLSAIMASCSLQLRLFFALANVFTH